MSSKNKYNYRSGAKSKDEDHSTRKRNVQHSRARDLGPARKSSTDGRERSRRPCTKRLPVIRPLIDDFREVSG